MTVSLHNDKGLGLAQPNDPSGHFVARLRAPITATNMPPTTLIPREALLTGASVLEGLRTRGE